MFARRLQRDACEAQARAADLLLTINNASSGLLFRRVVRSTTMLGLRLHPTHSVVINGYASLFWT